ncbi:MAG: hypothetical protein HY675_15730 [Chloroflexi bacterium]|nr:hypothetical protein [Chloroflexota bacterium]
MNRVVGERVGSTGVAALKQPLQAAGQEISPVCGLPEAEPFGEEVPSGRRCRITSRLAAQGVPEDVRYDV